MTSRRGTERGGTGWKDRGSEGRESPPPRKFTVVPTPMVVVYAKAEQYDSTLR